jgi:hypothetical protein
MFEQAAKRHVSAHLLKKAKDFRSDERGAIAIFVLMIFVMMLLVGGIAVDVMRSEMRRVAYQQTFDRAVLAASNIALPPSQTPVSIGQSWYDSAGLGDEFTVDYITPTISGEATTSSRKAEASGKVRSYNHFMHMMDIPYFEIPVKSAAQQGVSKIEVIMALDITGSMGEGSGSTTKIAALRQAATNFVTILKYNKDAGGSYTIPKDPNNLISIGMVPYSSNVNIPVALRNQFTVSHLSWWDGVANQGVQNPNVNCFEIPETTYSALALSRTDPIPMQAVAQTAGGAPNAGTITLPGANNTNGSNGGVVALGFSTGNVPSKNTNSYTCNHGDNFSTSGTDESGSNLIALPTTDIAALKTQIGQLNPRGTTSIAVGMRWATALIDESARPIYSALLGGDMAGRPANNTDIETRKIIVLMTDGTHVASKYIYDAYKSGPSPIWRGTDGKFAIEYNDSGVGLNGGTRPGINPNGNPKNTCSGWSLANTVVNGNTVKRNFFVPHLKANSVRLKNGNEAEGAGSGTNVTGGCDPRAWISATGNPAAPSWSGSGAVRRLDWSEVWRYVSVDWVIEQLYMRSNVTGATNYNTVYNTMVGNYLDGTANMDNLLSTNCTAAKQAGVEVFGIVLGDNVTEGPVKNCSSPGTGYYYRVTNADNLNAAFEQIAVLISELRLTQ